MRVVIFRAGIIGVSTACHLLERGHEVTVVERQGDAHTFTQARRPALLHRQPWPADSLGVRQAQSSPMTKTRTEIASDHPITSPDQPAAGKGMPARNPAPQAQRAPPGEHESAQDRSLENTLELPRDRDEAVDMTSGQPSPLMEQAAKDIEHGLKDTSKHPEMNQTYQKQKQR